MSKTAYLKGGSGIYHVMVKGSGRKNLFCQKQDFRACQRIILQEKKRYEFFLFAYCMMSSHMHLLLKCTFADISTVVQQICSGYEGYVNGTGSGEGRLFRGRFHIEPVEDEGYFLTIMSYIHENPCRAGIADKMEEYPFSSYREYVKGTPGMTDRGFVLSHMNLESFRKLHRQERQKERKKNGLARSTEQEAKRLLCEKINDEDPAVFKGLNLISQRSCVMELKKKNITYAQMSRLTGVPYERIRYLGNMKN